jgi:hypothetical protein
MKTGCDERKSAIITIGGSVLMEAGTLEWLLASDEPWTVYQTRRDLLGQPEDHPEVRLARGDMLAHPAIRDLMQQTASWPGYSLKRHNDAGYLLTKFSLLADFGVNAGDPGMAPGIQAVLAHQSEQGPFQTLVNIPRAFGGTDEDQWTWILCDAPTLLYVLLQMGVERDKRIEEATRLLIEISDENGWRCVSAPELGKFRGPGRKDDPCPIANLLALKAFSLLPEFYESPAVQRGIEMILGHWERRKEKKYYLFGMGSDFQKLKYPFVWYDLLHVMEVLSRYPSAIHDPRFREMLITLIGQAGEDGRYTAGSMYQHWKGWSFANKKNASPWLTFLVYRILKRVEAIAIPPQVLQP